jgi:hypothetical protein
MAAQEKEKRDQKEDKRNQGSQQGGGSKQNQGNRSGGDRERESEGRTQKTSK